MPALDVDLHEATMAPAQLGVISFISIKATDCYAKR